MKTITIAGRLTKDAEMRTTQNGDRILQFSVAVDDYNNGQKGTAFFDVAVFGKRAVSLEQHLTKGGSVCVSGDFGTNEHNGKTYLKIVASNVTLMGSPQRRDDAPRQQQTRQPSVKEDRNFMDDMGDEDIPF